MEDGNSAAVLMYPEAMTEEQALEAVQMDGRELRKLHEIHNQTEGFRTIEYMVHAGIGTFRSPQDDPNRQGEFA